MAAFDLALKQGCDGFEFDVRLTADGTGIVCHNPKSAGVVIAKATAENLRALPMLDEVLAGYASRAFLDIELKVPGVESKLLAALRRYPLQRGYVVSSFFPQILINLRACSESIPLGVICETGSELRRWRELPVQYVIAKQSLIKRELVDGVHKDGKLIFAWTVNKRESMVQLAEWGIDGLISDKADLLSRVFRS